MNVDRWLARALVASFGVNLLLAVWLWSASRKPENVERATHEYRQARTARDSARTVRVSAVDNYSRAREVLTITDTVEVERVLTLADSAIAAGERSEAAADTALAKADALIRELRGKKPRRVVPWVEAHYSPYSKGYHGRAGFDVRVVNRLSLIAAADVRKEGPGMSVGVRVTF